MPNLVQSLQTRDLGHLRVVARLWGVELGSAEYEAALKELTSALLDPDLVGEMVDSLSMEAKSALEKLVETGGKMPWAAFARQFGDIREAGPGRRDREQGYLNSASAAETLFYRGFLARAFFDLASGAQEFAYIPEDLAKLIISKSSKVSPSNPVDPPGRPATIKEYAQPISASDRILDDATTCLAALRLGMEPPELPTPVRVVKELLEAAGIVNGESSRPEQVKAFLEMSRQQALALLTKTWRGSEVFNDLHMLPGLVCEGEWTNQPLATRSFLFHLLEALPEGKWWNLPAFVLGIKAKYPDFQRPAGDYDSWFIKRLSDGAYLRGFECWDEVDGALLRYIITGPLFWLGLVELASPAQSESVTAFRVNEKPIVSAEKGKLSVASNGRISVPRLVSRVTRYLIARFCEWEGTTQDEFHYRVTTGSLTIAGKQGLKVGQLLSLLAKNAAGGIPPAFVKALKRWEAKGTEARVEAQTILRVSRPEVLEELRKSKAERFLGETLGPVTVIVKPGAQARVLAALAELGLLAESTPASEAPKN
ncbi:MAG: helicase-associated domain-containing protein [Anaerolineales bacterium]|jgi:hypothetical protein